MFDIDRTPEQQIDDLWREHSVALVARRHHRQCADTRRGADHILHHSATIHARGRIPRQPSWLDPTPPRCGCCHCCDRWSVSPQPPFECSDRRLRPNCGAGHQHCTRRSFRRWCDCYHRGVREYHGAQDHAVTNAVKGAPRIRRRSGDAATAQRSALRRGRRRRHLRGQHRDGGVGLPVVHPQPQREEHHREGHA